MFYCITIEPVAADVDVKQNKIRRAVKSTAFLNFLSDSLSEEDDFLVPKGLLKQLFLGLTAKQFLKSRKQMCRNLSLVSSAHKTHSVAIPTYPDVCSVRFVCELPLGIFQILKFRGTIFTLNQFVLAKCLSLKNVRNLYVLCHFFSPLLQKSWSSVASNL